MQPSGVKKKMLSNSTKTRNIIYSTECVCVVYSMCTTRKRGKNCLKRDKKKNYTEKRKILVELVYHCMCVWFLFILKCLHNALDS